MNNILFSYEKYNLISFIDTTKIDEIINFNNYILKDIQHSHIVFKYIYNILLNISIENSFNFISIGSASNLEVKYYNILPQKDNHQIPSFLNKIINNNKYNKINIFLIDERLETPPYIINNSNLNFKKIKKNYWKFNNINIYSFKLNINKFDSELEYLIKISNILDIYSKIIINDYSGLEIDKILEYKFNSL
jgi:hypothetical protein